MFSFNSAYIGSRLGTCWEILEEKHEEFRSHHVRDPYPLIAEKAGLEKGLLVSRLLRSIAIGKICPILHMLYTISYPDINQYGYKIQNLLIFIFTVCMIATLYGAAIVFNELIADFLFDLTEGRLTMCLWMMITVGILTPVTWLGEPKDFW